MLTVFDIGGVEMQRNIEKKMLGMKNHFDISGSIEIREVDIAGVACISKHIPCYNVLMELGHKEQGYNHQFVPTLQLL